MPSWAWRETVTSKLCSRSWIGTLRQVLTPAPGSLLARRPIRGARGVTENALAPALLYLSLRGSAVLVNG